MATQVLPIAGAQTVDAHVGLFLALDGEHADQHDQPLRVRGHQASLPMARKLRKPRRMEKVEKVGAGCLYPLLRNHAPSAAFLHMPPISASIYTSLPQLGSFAKCRDPSSVYHCGSYAATYSRYRRSTTVKYPRPVF